MEENDCQRFRRVPLRVCRTAVKKDRANLRILKDSEAVCSSPYRVRPFHGQRMDLCYQYLFQHPGRYRLVKEEQMAYWQYIGEPVYTQKTRFLPEKWFEISWRLLTLCFHGGVHIGRETLKLTRFYSCPKLKACLPSMTSLSTTDIYKCQSFCMFFFFKS